jgi:hypothetical protein
MAFFLLPHCASCVSLVFLFSSSSSHLIQVLVPPLFLLLLLLHFLSLSCSRFKHGLDMLAGKDAEAGLVEARGTSRGRKVHADQGQAAGVEPAHSVRGGKVPKHWDMLGRGGRPHRNCHYHADGRHLHTGLPILCSQNFKQASSPGSK